MVKMYGEAVLLGILVYYIKLLDGTDVPCKRTWV